MHVLHWVMGLEITAAVASLGLLGWVLRSESAWRRVVRRAAPLKIIRIGDPGRRAAVPARRVHVITDARPSRAIEGSK